MKFRKKTKEEDLNFWQPTTDLMSGLVYIMLLVALLLGFYVIQIPENDGIDDQIGDAYGTVYPTLSPSPTPAPTGNGLNGGWGWGGWGGGDGNGQYTPIPSLSPTVTVTPTVTPNTGNGNGYGDGHGDDYGKKSAVYVMLVDAETDRTVKAENVEFELYEADGALQILNVYYPEKISFRKYLTTEDGTFFLPEKLFGGTYELHELTEAEGYDAAENQRFSLDDIYDWPEPYVVRVPVYASRNVIRVQMTDAETGLNVSGGSFEVIAREDIITLDRTLRCYAGEVVDVIECDENGYGESKPLYLGEYTLRQKEIPEYYASLTDEREVTVVKKAAIEPAVEPFESERTKIRFRLTDELYPSSGIADVKFTVNTGSGKRQEYSTDSEGYIELNELDKATAYHLTQISSTGDYRFGKEEVRVNVAADGRIDGEAQKEVNVTNRMLRVLIGITDQFSNTQIPGENLSLYNAEGELLRVWTSSGTGLMLTNLKPGEYSIVRESTEEEENRYGIRVADTAEIQTINIHSINWLQYVLYGGAAFVLLAAIVIIGVMIGRKRKQRK